MSKISEHCNEKALHFVDLGHWSYWLGHVQTVVPSYNARTDAAPVSANGCWGDGASTRAGLGAAPLFLRSLAPRDRIRYGILLRFILFANYNLITMVCADMKTRGAPGDEPARMVPHPETGIGRIGRRTIQFLFFAGRGPGSSIFFVHLRYFPFHFDVCSTCTTEGHDSMFCLPWVLVRFGTCPDSLSVRRLCWFAVHSFSYYF